MFRCWGWTCCVVIMSIACGGDDDRGPSAAELIAEHQARVAAALASREPECVYSDVTDDSEETWAEYEARKEAWEAQHHDEDEEMPERVWKRKRVKWCRGLGIVWDSTGQKH